MRIDHLEVEGVRVAALHGRLDSNTVAAVEQPICDEVKASPALVLDLAGVPYVSSAGLRVFLRAAKLAKANGRRLVLAGLTPAVEEVFAVSGFTPLFDIRPDRAGAVAAAAGG